MKNTGSEKYRELLPQARELERHIDTDWAEAHEDQYEAFADQLEYAWHLGLISDAEFNSLVAIAFYDYPEDLKGDGDDEDLIEQELALEQPIVEYHRGCGRREC